MISKSVKAKRRRNAEFLQQVSQIRVSQIDTRNGCRLYLISWPYFNPHWDIYDSGGWKYHHLECKGRRILVEEYGALLQAVKDKGSSK